MSHAQVAPVLQAPPQQLRPPPPAPPPDAPVAIPASPSPGVDVPPGADQVFLTPTAIVVDGVTAYPSDVIDALTRPLVGRRIAATEVFAVAKAIERKYRDDGFFLTSVTVPAQRVATGQVTLRVIEGFVSSVVIEGDAGDVSAQARRYLQNLVGRKPVNLREMERYLLLTEDMPGLSIKAVLRPGSEPASSELVVQLQRKPFDAFGQFDNRGFKNTGPRQVTVGVGSNSFTGLAERLEGTFFTTLSREQNFGQVNFSAAIGAEGFRLSAYGGRGYIKPGGPLKALAYEGLVTIAGVAGKYPVIRSRQLNLNVGGGFDYYRSTVDVLDNVRLNTTELRVLRLVADANYRDEWNGVTFGNIRLSQGIEALGASKKGDPQLNRAGADPAFRKVNGEVSRLQGLWANDTVSLGVLGTLAGQYSDDILPSNEKFFVGGDRLGRGYYSGQVTGDKAIAGTLELQFNFVVPFDPAAGGSGPTLPGSGTPVQLYAFYDHARAWNNASLEKRGITARSVGAGARISLLESASVELEGTRRLDRDVDGVNAKKLDPWDFFVRLTTRF
jgi:hemolysin activation/secretion protein